jgi:predicted NBD/HSP70 family sugar kinase
MPNGNHKHAKLTRDETKQHNQRLVLKLIYGQDAISRADLARATGLTRATASLAVGELMEQGLVEEIGQGVSAGGKPPTLLHIVPRARHVIGIDLSGVTLQGAVLDLHGAIVQRLARPAPAGDGQAPLDATLALLDDLTAAATQPLLGIGVGLPGLLDSQHGAVCRAVNRGWRDLPLQDLLQERYQVPVLLANDSQAAALAEYAFANPAGSQDLAVILLGQGISAGLVLSGEVFQGGNRLGASEIGHVRVVEGGELCTCGHYGCLETVAGHDALLRGAQTLYRSDPGSILRQLAASADDLALDAVIRACQAGDAQLNQMVARSSRFLSVAVAHLISVLNLPLVVLAGSLAALGPALLAPLQADLAQRMLPELAQRTEVRISALGDEIVMRGAAALVLADELGVI